MKKKPRISVVIPVYQTEHYLRQCLDSLVVQSFPDFEVVLIDDGSKDGSGSICDEYSARDSRFNVVHVANGGVSKARNIGIERTKGDYIVFVDSDDWVESGYFQSIVGYLDKYDLLFYGMKSISGDGTDRKFEYKTEQIFSDDSSLSAVIYDLFEKGILGYMGAMCVRRDLVMEYRIRLNEEISLHEDAIFAYECLMHTDKICSLSIQPYRYRIDMQGNSLSMKLPDNYLDICIIRIFEIERLLTHIGMKEEWKDKILSFLKYTSYSGSFDWACKQPKKVKAIREIFVRLESLADFQVKPTVKTRLIGWAIKYKNPYIVLFGKWVSRFFPKKDSVSMK